MSVLRTRARQPGAYFEYGVPPSSGNGGSQGGGLLHSIFGVPAEELGLVLSALVLVAFGAGIWMLAEAARPVIEDVEEIKRAREGGRR